MARLEKLHGDKPQTIYSKAMYHLALKEMDEALPYLKKVCDIKEEQTFIISDAILKQTACGQYNFIKNSH